MISVAVLLLACTAMGVSSKGLVCETRNGANLVTFAGHNIDMFFPCKYWALKRQQCGPYRINLSPGNRWISPYYQLDTLWLGINNTETGQYWEGRTTNKIAVKAHNSGLQRHLFVQKDGTYATTDLFDIGSAPGAGVYVQVKDVFKVTFMPWDPSNREKYPKAQWKFECFDTEGVTLNEYPEQMCGGSNFKKEMENRTRSLGLEPGFSPMSVYYDTFYTHADIAQTEGVNFTVTQRTTGIVKQVKLDKKCVNSVKVLRRGLCRKDAAYRVTVLNNCVPMLYNTKRTECLTSFNCNPMEPFFACLRWGCKEGFRAKTENGEKSAMCAEVAERIELCPTLAGAGNLTDRVAAANCYSGFLKIEKPAGKSE